MCVNVLLEQYLGGLMALDMPHQFRGSECGPFKAEGRVRHPHGVRSNRHDLREEVRIMTNISVHRYEHESIKESWQGWIEPDDRSWIAFIDADGKPLVYLNRDPDTGAVIE